MTFWHWVVLIILVLAFIGLVKEGFKLVFSFITFIGKVIASTIGAIMGSIERRKK